MKDFIVLPMPNDEDKLMVKQQSTGWFYPNLSKMEAGTLVQKFNELSEKPLDLHTDFQEWSDKLEWLQKAEKELITLKLQRDEETQKILLNFDFKEAYGKNNETIRKNHIKKELAPIYDKITTLELDINDTKRKISFIKSLIKMKTELLKLGVRE